ncbi:MAG: hypothetical protein ACOCRO_02990 [Halanaerobiales bacterium]
MGEQRMTKATRVDSLLENNKKKILAKAKETEKNKKAVSKKQKRQYLKAIANDDYIELPNGKKVKAREAYAEALVENTTVGIEAQLVFTEFLNMESLSPPEDPLYYTLDQPLTEDGKLYEISQHGGTPREMVIQKEKDIVRITPYEITSDEESMSKWSLKQGDLTNEEAMRNRVAKAIAKKEETDSKTLLENGLFTDIDDVDGVYIEDEVEEYPTANDLDLTSEEGLTLEVFKQIAKHFDMLGKTVRNVYIPSNRRYDLWDWLSIPAGYDDGSDVDADTVIPQGLHEEVVRTGTVNNLFGYPVNLVPLNTLNGSSGSSVYAWVATNDPAGEYRDIPAYSSVFRDEDARRVYFTENRVLAMFQTPNQRLNYARVEFDD